MTFQQVNLHNPKHTHSTIAIEAIKLPKQKHKLVPNIHHWTHNTIYYFNAAQPET
jgi:hypothetical protein